MIDYIPAELLLPPSCFPCRHSHFGTHPTRVPQRIAPFFSCAYAEPILQPLCFQIHACNGGYPSSTFGRSDLQTFWRVSNLSPFFSILSGHSYTTAAHQPFCNQFVTPTFHRD